MCRLVAYAGPPRSPAALVYGGDHSLYHQSFQPRELLSGTVNADGYGVAWYHDGEPVRRGSPFPIWQDEDVRGLLESVRSNVILAAVRNTTAGIPASPTGVAPVVVGTCAFALNGFVPDFRRRFMRRVHGWIADAWYGSLTGVSDTEALAVLAASLCDAGASPGEALADLVQRVSHLVREEGVVAQLNMVLSDGETVAASRAASQGRPNSLYRSTASPLAPGGIVLASEALGGGGDWDPVPSGTVIEWNRDGGVVEDRPL